MDASTIAVATAVMPGTLRIMAAVRAHTTTPPASGNALFAASEDAAASDR
jgi:hypothetical protein